MKSNLEHLKHTIFPMNTSLIECRHFVPSDSPDGIDHFTLFRDRDKRQKIASPLLLNEVYFNIFG